MIFWCKIEGTDERERNCYGGLEYNRREWVSPERPACSRRIQPNKINKSDVLYRLNFHTPPQKSKKTKQKKPRRWHDRWQEPMFCHSFFIYLNKATKTTPICSTWVGLSIIGHFTESTSFLIITHQPNINSLQADDSSWSKLTYFRNPKTFIEKDCRL